MIGMRFKAAKEGFFDRAKVMKALGKAKLDIFKEFGRLVRKRAQASLKYAKDISAPGSPPHAHRTGRRTKISKKTGKPRTYNVSPLREFLFFAYDTSSQSVVIGPARLGGTVDPNALPALERGGSSTAKGRKGLRSISVRARPFMGPAAAAEIPGLPRMWRDSVR
jgi:hypothetical protein